MISGILTKFKIYFDFNLISNIINLKICLTPKTLIHYFRKYAARQKNKVTNIHCYLQIFKCITCKKERRRLRGEKDDGDGSARQKEKRKAKEKVDGFGERRHGKGWS